MIQPITAKNVLQNLNTVFPRGIDTNGIEPPIFEMLYADYRVSGGVIVKIEDVTNSLDTTGSNAGIYKFPNINGTLHEVMDTVEKMWEWSGLEFISSQERRYYVESIDFDFRAADPTLTLALIEYDLEDDKNASVAGDSWNDWAVNAHVSNPNLLYNINRSEVEHHMLEVKGPSDRYYNPRTVVSYRNEEMAMTKTERNILERNRNDEYVALLVSRLYIPEIHTLHPYYGKRAFTTLYYQKNGAFE